jgi:hypothetical protein
MTTMVSRDDERNALAFKTQMQIAKNLELYPPNIIRNESSDDDSFYPPAASKSKQAFQQPPPQRMTYNPQVIGGNLSFIREEEKMDRHDMMSQYSMQASRYPTTDLMGNHVDPRKRWKEANITYDPSTGEERIKVTKSQLSGVMKSKLDIYTILTRELQFYLPPIHECPMDFISDLMLGKKKMLKTSMIRMVNVPGFRELSGKSVYEQIIGMSVFQQYLPDLHQVKKPLSRQYVYNVR